MSGRAQRRVAGGSEEPRDICVTGDVIESAPPPRRPVLVRVVGIAAAVLVVTGLVVLRGIHATESFESTPTVTGSTTDLVVSLPDHIATEALVPGIDLGTFVAPTHPPVVLDTTTRTRRAIPALPAGSADSSFDVTDLGRGRFLIVASYLSGSAVSAFLASGATATLVATGDAIVVGADGASVLVSSANGTAGQTVQRYDLAGHEVGGPVALGPDEYLDADTVDGWVVSNDSTNQRQVRDPATGAVRHEIEEPMVVGAHAIAYALPDGRLAVDTLRGGGSASTSTYPRLPRTGVVYRARLSPDARYLAVVLVGINPVDLTVLVLDRTAGGWTVLPGTPVRPHAGRGLEITWGGDVLVVASGDGAVALWRPGDSTVYAAPAPQNSAS